MYLPAVILSSLAAMTPGAQMVKVGYTPPPPITAPAVERQPLHLPPPREAEAVAPPRNSVEVSVLTYNVRGLPWPFARNRARALRAIGQELAQLRAEGRQPDIVLIQEGFRREIEDLVTASGYRYWARGPRKGDRVHGSPPESAGSFRKGRYLPFGEGWGKFTNGGLHVLSDLPITAVESVPYRYCAGFDCLANKGVMLVRVTLPGLPGPVDVVNTHMNSRRAAKVPVSRSHRAHNLQTEELVRFLAERAPGTPLLVGGDFNVKDSPRRYYHRLEARPFTVVSEYCVDPRNACAGEAPVGQTEPWLKAQDLHAFASRGGVEIRPVRMETLFDSPDSGGVLSDHAAQLVRYRLSWTPSRPAAPQLVTVASNP